MKISTLAFFLPIAALAACDSSGDTKGTPAEDTTVAPNDTSVATQEDTSTATGDDTAATTTPDATPADTSAPDNSCSVTGFKSVGSTFSKDQGSVIVDMRSTTTANSDLLQLEIYTSGNYAGATDVGTYSLDGSTYQDCANCVVIRAQCTNGNCAEHYLVDAGNLVITQWDFAGGSFKAHLDHAVAHEVTIDADYVSTLVPGGKTWCLDGADFDATIDPLPISDRTQPTCVADGTGTILNDNIANFSLTNCNGHRIKLHATCNDTTQKALWLVGTAGWCSACHEFLTEKVAEHGGFLSRKAIGDRTPGLDMLILLGEDASGEKPTQAYCKAYAADLGIDPEMVMIDWSDTAVPIPVVNDPNVTVQTNSLGTVWGHMDPYLYEDNTGSVATYYPWWGLLRPRNMEYVWSDRAALQSFQVTILGLLSEN